MKILTIVKQIHTTKTEYIRYFKAIFVEYFFWLIDILQVFITRKSRKKARIKNSNKYRKLSPLSF